MFSATTTDIKAFMNEFLTGTGFDHFLLCEASIKTGSTYIIDGHINKEFYDTDDVHLDACRIYQYWSECRPIAFQIVKGSRPPLAMKIVLMLAPEQLKEFLQKYNISISADQISGLYLNIRYEYGTLHLSAGTALTIFTLDKTVEHMWEEQLSQFFQQMGITLMTD